MVVVIKFLTHSPHNFPILPIATVKEPTSPAVFVIVGGSDLEELPEDMQRALDRVFVEECRVDYDVVAFMVMWVDYREQEEYVR